MPDSSTGPNFVLWSPRRPLAVAVVEAPMWKLWRDYYPASIPAASKLPQVTIAWWVVFHPGSGPAWLPLTANIAQRSMPLCQ